MDSMNSEQSYDMIGADAYSVDELRETTFEGRGRLSRPLALALLGRKSYPQKVQDLERLLTNEQEMPRLRAMSAQFLGEIGGPDATRVLERSRHAPGRHTQGRGTGARQDGISRARLPSRVTHPTTRSRRKGGVR